jgi:hypothetical protein
MRKHVGGLAASLMALAILAALAWSVVDWLDRPEVQVSYETGRCVAVRDYKAEYEGRVSEWSCDKLPERYERVWVR